MTTDPLAALDASDEERQQHIVAVLVDAFDDLIEADPRAFRRKFRKMAADPFAFYRGSAPLFYADVGAARGPAGSTSARRACGSRATCTPRTTAPTWTPPACSSSTSTTSTRPTSATTPGTSSGWPPRSPSSASPRRSPTAPIRRLIETYATAYPELVRTFATDRPATASSALTLDNTEGALRDVLEAARLETRVAAARPRSRRSTRATGASPSARGARELDEEERARSCAAYEAYLDTIPAAKRQHSISYAVKDVVGRSGLRHRQRRAARLQPARRGPHPGAGERRRPLHEAGPVPAPSRVVRDDRIRATTSSTRATAPPSPSTRCRRTPTRGWAGASSTASAR